MQTMYTYSSVNTFYIVDFTVNYVTIFFNLRISPVYVTGSFGSINMDRVVLIGPVIINFPTSSRAWVFDVSRER